MGGICKKPNTHSPQSLSKLTTEVTVPTKPKYYAYINLSEQSYDSDTESIAEEEEA